MYSEYQSIKFPSQGHFCAKLTEAHVILIKCRWLNLKVESVGFVRAVPERTRKWVNCWVSFPECQIETFWIGKVSWAQPRRQKHSNCAGAISVYTPGSFAALRTSSGLLLSCTLFISLLHRYTRLAQSWERHFLLVPNLLPYRFGKVTLEM